MQLPTDSFRHGRRELGFRQVHVPGTPICLLVRQPHSGSLRVGLSSLSTCGRSDGGITDVAEWLQSESVDGVKDVLSVLNKCEKKSLVEVLSPHNYLPFTLLCCAFAFGTPIEHGRIALLHCPAQLAHRAGWTRSPFFSARNPFFPFKNAPYRSFAPTRSAWSTGWIPC